MKSFNALSSIIRTELPYHSYMDRQLNLKGARFEDFWYYLRYKMSFSELEECRKYIIEKLKKKRIFY